MNQESPRLDRIEHIVTALEVDIKTMSKAVTELAGSVKQLGVGCIRVRSNPLSYLGK